MHGFRVLKNKPLFFIVKGPFIYFCYCLAAESDEDLLYTGNMVVSNYMFVLGLNFMLQVKKEKL
jgi:hypothetical protein